MKITEQYEKKPTTIALQKVKVGTVFRGKVGGIEGLFLRSYCGVVNLTNPKDDWFMADAVTVHDYAPHDVELIDRGPIEE